MKAYQEFLARLVLIGMVALCGSCVHFRQTQPSPPSADVAPTGWLGKMSAKIFPPRKKPKKALVPLWFGTVSLVDLENGYVLIDSNALYAVIPGKELRCLSKERETARLRITGEKNPPFFIADILSGTPRVGDRVYAPDHP